MKVRINENIEVEIEDKAPESPVEPVVEKDGEEKDE